jgi:flagellar protein FliO/FliZ
MLLSSPCFAATPVKSAQEISGTGIGVETWLSAFAGLGFIILLIIGLAWFIKRFTGLTGTSRSQIKVLTVLPVGTRERIALIEVGGRQMLVGITSHQINLLKDFEGVVVSSEVPISDFANRLQSLLKSTKPDSSSQGQETSL